MEQESCVNYCGITNLSDGNFSSCQACSWGYRVFKSEGDHPSLCQPCRTPLLLYDWLFLGFMAIIPLLLHSFFIEFCAQKKCTKKILLLQHASSLVECVFAGVVSLLVISPRGSLTLQGCGVRQLSDWYTMFFNPTLNFTTTIHCTQEAVFPLYSLPFIYYALCLLNLGVVRPLFLCPLRCRKTGVGGGVYAALYFYPILTLTHAVLAGLLYYSFPYLLLLSSLFSNALHFAKYPDQSPKMLVLDTLSNTRNMCVVLTHWLLYAYCVASFTQFREPVLNGCLMLLVPVPCIFYVLTVGMSDPKKLTVT